jgi:tellurite resistance protein
MQLATVGQDSTEQAEDEEVELAMSGLRQDDAAAARLVLGCAVLVAAAGGVALARRRRSQHALQPVL